MDARELTRDEKKKIRSLVTGMCANYDRESDPFLLLYKRLYSGAFQWPRSADEAKEISPDQYQMLMQGYSQKEPDVFKKGLVLFLKELDV